LTRFCRIPALTGGNGSFGIVMFRAVVLVAMCAALAGCSSGLLGGGSPSPSARPQIVTNNELTLPPSLELAAPGTGVAPAPAPAPQRQLASTPSAAVPTVYGDAPAGVRNARDPMQPTLDKYGISRLKPDGTPKSDWELRREIRAAVIADKRKTNPNYGTVFNAGELFDDN
jgi:hypothetical protein